MDIVHQSYMNNESVIVRAFPTRAIRLSKLSNESVDGLHTLGVSRKLASSVSTSSMYNESCECELSRDGHDRPSN